MKKLRMFNLSCFIGKRYFDNDESQNYLLFHSIYNTFKRRAGDTETILALRLPDEIIKSPTAPVNSPAPKLKWIHNSKKVEFKESCLKQDKVTFSPKRCANFFVN